MNTFSLLLILVPHGQARKIIHEGRSLGLTGATTLIADGTVKSKVLDFLGINHIQKEVILTVGEHDALVSVMDALNRQLNITRKNFGIACLLPISFCNKRNAESVYAQTGETMNTMKSAIFTIVNRGRANDVVDATIQAGARGGTVLHARGSGANQTKLIFDIEIEPEKEIVLTIVDTEQVETVVAAIREHSEIEQDGHGILFVLPVTESYGLK